MQMDTNRAASDVLSRTHVDSFMQASTLFIQQIVEAEFTDAFMCAAALPVFAEQARGAGYEGVQPGDLSKTDPCT